MRDEVSTVLLLEVALWNVLGALLLAKFDRIVEMLLKGFTDMPRLSEIICNDVRQFKKGVHRECLELGVAHRLGVASKQYSPFSPALDFRAYLYQVLLDL